MKKEPILQMPSRPTNQLVEEIEQAVSTINNNAPPPAIPREFTEPEQLGESAANAMIETANRALIEAQNHVEETKARADKIRADIRAWATDHENIMNRLRELGQDLLNSDRKYNDGRK